MWSLRVVKGYEAKESVEGLYEQIADPPVSISHEDQIVPVRYVMSNVHTSLPPNHSLTNRLVPPSSTQNKYSAGKMPNPRHSASQRQPH